MADFGVSFVPGDDPMQRQAGPGGAAPSGVSPLQSAIRLLSMRLPRIGGAGLSPGALAPGALLNAPGGGGLGAGGGLEALLRALFGLGGQAAGGGMPQMTPAQPLGAPPPLPKFTPGDPDLRMAPGGPPDPTVGGIVPPGGFAPSGASQPTSSPIPPRSPYRPSY
jgi:hypothetical protein